MKQPPPPLPMGGWLLRRALPGLLSHVVTPCGLGSHVFVFVTRCRLHRVRASSELYRRWPPFTTV